MTEASDTFAELTRQGHQVFTAAVQAWEQAARSMADAAGRPGTQLPDVGASVDAAFDFAAQMLADQRDFTRTLMSAGAQAFAAAARRPGAGDGDEIAGGLPVHPAQDADQPGADTAAATAPAPPTPASPAATGDGDGPATETAAAPRRTTAKKTAAKKTTAEKTTAEKTTAAAAPAAGRTAAKKAAAKKTTAKKATAPGTPAKRAAARSRDGS